MDSRTELSNQPQVQRTEQRLEPQTALQWRLVQRTEQHLEPQTALQWRLVQRTEQRLEPQMALQWRLMQRTEQRFQRQQRCPSLQRVLQLVGPLRTSYCTSL